MNDGNGEQPERIRFIVYTGTDGKPWICRLKLVGKSPKGRVLSYQALDTDRPHTEKWPSCRAAAETREEAVQRFQQAQVVVFAPRNFAPEARVRRIIEAQALLDGDAGSDPCRVCGGETNVVVNIGLKATRVCDSCCESIAMQTLNDLCRKSMVERGVTKAKVKNETP